MRIISGSFKGKRLMAPKNLPVRPTTDMAKEGLFNILNNRYYFDELKVLDLFSGTGNIAYEFASRGSRDITVVDAHFGCIKYIDQTAAQLNVPINSIKMDVFSFLEKTTDQFDIIFADPPYDMDVEDFNKIVELTFERTLLKPGGSLIVEHEKHTHLKEAEGFLEDRKYGGSVFSFYTREEEEEE
jgi:16S rRNA (guanine(966)-N(2))-methyltransferase RsmD